jgi:hypothetical protein
MKKTWERLVLLSVLSSLPLCAADARMTPEERTKVLNWLEESRKEFLSAIDGVNEQQWKWKPVPERWSVGEIAEHVVLAEASQFGNVKKAISLPANPAWDEETKGKTERLVAILAPRLGKAQAAEAIVPKGEITLSQVRERFERQRSEIVKFATETDLPLKQYTLNNAFFGTLNGYHWLIYALLHTMRHVKQIAEVKGTIGYPK